ncbi:hypothetical protein KO561_05150 [Radiobacillus kanasensis]|uniref:hypothetical protein n=1 Tax=Radiobacillus kanasensis TaxID=2844358 RepID=UPI001E2D3730|nr:hypothetical protein [Radiobacillus kanasensis]UFU00339.1 hypothetical protein KO561_05150 [Radiobacillus kanasensis]
MFEQMKKYLKEAKRLGKEKEFLEYFYGIISHASDTSKKHNARYDYESFDYWASESLKEVSGHVKSVE